MVYVAPGFLLAASAMKTRTVRSADVCVVCANPDSEAQCPTAGVVCRTGIAGVGTVLGLILQTRAEHVNVNWLTAPRVLGTTISVNRGGVCVLRAAPEAPTVSRTRGAVSGTRTARVGTALVRVEVSAVCVGPCSAWAPPAPRTSGVRPGGVCAVSVRPGVPYQTAGAAGETANVGAAGAGRSRRPRYAGRARLRSRKVMLAAGTTMSVSPVVVSVSCAGPGVPAPSPMAASVATTTTVGAGSASARAEPRAGLATLEKTPHNTEVQQPLNFMWLFHYTFPHRTKVW